MKKILLTLVMLLSGTGIARAQWDSIGYLPALPFMKTRLLAYCYENEYGGTPSNPIGYGSVSKSLDGCNTWQEILEMGGEGHLFTCSFWEVDFPNDTTGYLYAYTGCSPGLYQTTDGGSQWNKIINGVDYPVYTYSFPRSDYGYFTAFDNNYSRYFLANYDHYQLNVLDSVPITVSGIQSMKFVNDSTGFFFYGTNSSMLYRTNDRCHTLTQVFDSIGSVKKIVFAGTQKCFILKKPDSLFASSDLGITWSFVNVIPLTHIYDFFFLTADTGWACGPAGKILKTANSGRDWEEIPSTTNSDIIRIGFFSGNDGYFIAEKYYNFLLYRTHLFNGSADQDTPVRILQNPAREKLNLVSINPLYPVTSLELLSGLGKSVYFSGYFKNEIDICNLPPGLYFLRYNFQQHTYTEKFLVARD